MNPARFIAKWSRADLTERSAAQQHFLDLCELVDHPKPADVDSDGSWFTFERGAAKRGGGDGWADVWKRGFFGWEYKGRRKDLSAAYDQLLQYREALENPPLLVVCDLDRIVVHTNFTATAARVYEISLASLTEARSLEILRAVFHDPEKLRPGATSEAVTTEAARRIGELALTLRARGLEPRAVARFLDRVVFCLFAEDIDLLPAGLFTSLLDKTRTEPARFGRLAGQLFEAMARGGDFGLETIRRFNGGLFASAETLELTEPELASLAEAGRLDWGAVDPSIFGTLFVRGMDPALRAQLGAQYTSRADIETLVEPVVLAPLRREWEETRAVCESLLTTGKKQPGGTTTKPLSSAALKKARGEASSIAHRFLLRLSQVKVLDPACGSGNFLYVTLQKLKDLEKEALLYAMDRGLGAFLPLVGPWQLYGIDVNSYALDLAQMAVWIGYLQWTRANGFGVTQDPILRPMEGNFRLTDAVLDLSDPANPREPEWPAVDFLVGNPPFLGNKRMRSELGAEYCGALWKLYGDRIPAMSDLCCYWFEKARGMVESGRCQQAGLLATTGIRQVGGRRVLERIHDTCRIFFAVSDRDWVLDGAAVRISMVGFGPKVSECPALLDGREVAEIHAGLTAGLDLTVAQPLASNARRCFMGTTKVGAFDVTESVALRLLEGVNPHGRPTSDVVRPFKNGSDLVRADSGRWIIDFGVNRPLADACLYEGPFEHLAEHVKPEREKNNDAWRRQHWWLLGRSISTFRDAVIGKARYLATPRVAKHRVFVWLDTVVLPDSKVIAVALDDDASLGMLQSRVHTVWTLAMCGWHGKGNDVTYNPTTCFETFPFPEPNDAQREAIAAAARELDDLRGRWLNPPEWTREEVLEFPGSADGPWARYVQDGVVRYPRLVPQDADCAAKLAKRTLTNLYNQRPAWLDLAHRKLDEAVLAAYGWPTDLSDDELLERLLALNLERAGGG